MFAFDRSALAVLAPLALLLAVVLYSNRAPDQIDERQVAQAQPSPERADQTVAANLPSR
jgi:K+-transporting ATPase A subunit